VNGACLCGRVTVRVPGQPTYLNACNCEACTKLGAMWGYYPREEVEIGGEPVTYVREDRSDPYLSFHFCAACGSTINWAPIPGDAPDRLGINMRLFDPAELKGVELRFGNRREHDTVEPRRYYREATTFDGQGAA
jgi:hypothetical protein